MHGCGLMEVAEFAEQCADGEGFLSIDIGGADFGFSGRSHDFGNDFGHGVNGYIELRESSGGLCRIRRTVAEKIMATGAAAGTGRRKVQGVAVGV